MRNLLPLKIATLVVLCIVLVLGFSAQEPVADWRHGELVVILPPTDSIDYQFNRQLAEQFATHLGVRLKGVEYYPYQIPGVLNQGYAHLSATGMRANEGADNLSFGIPYQVVAENLICGGKQPATTAELLNRRIWVVRNSPQDLALRGLKKKLPELEWGTVDKELPAELIEDVSSGNLDCTVANDEQISLMKNFHSELEPSLEIGEPTQLAWAFAKEADADLMEEMKKFFDRIEKDGTLDLLIDRYYGHTDRIMPIDAATFISRANTVLPRYRATFEEAASLTGLDWQLLAAMAYRESHWNPLATSYTKVRGMMMLTEETADRMKVNNRLDARESILAGARYLQLLKEELPLRIDEPERTWLALAAYNQGMGHLEDARMLTQGYGGNPDQWVDVQKGMIKLRNPNIAKSLKHGYARGGEAVVFVETVRLYYDMLKRITRDEYRQLLPPDYQIRLNAW